MEETKNRKLSCFQKDGQLNIDEVQFFMSTQVGSFSMIKMQF